MIGASRRLWPLLILIAGVQTVALAKIVFDRDRLLKRGQEITLPVRPVDPRDLFRGDYVTLGYEIAALHKPATYQTLNDQGIERGARVYVTLAKDSAGAWKAADIATAYPSRKKDDDVVLRGRVQSVWVAADKSEATITVAYGIEQYFVPEGKGKAIESKVREHKTDAVVAVGSDGTAALKGLVLDGERHIDPPLL